MRHARKFLVAGAVLVLIGGLTWWSVSEWGGGDRLTITDNLEFEPIPPIEVCTSLELSQKVELLPDAPADLRARLDALLALPPMALDADDPMPEEWRRFLEVLALTLPFDGDCKDRRLLHVEVNGHPLVTIRPGE